MKYLISLIGCDAVTELELPEQEFTFLKNLEILFEEKSTYGCEPIITVVEVE